MLKSKTTIIGGPIVFDLDLDLVAEALAADLRAAIAAQPGDKWHKTGQLAGGIRVAGDEVSVSSGRLVEGRIAEAFADQVMPASPLESRRVRAATEQAIAQSLKGKSK